jgi:hypothetical protein
VTATLPRAHSMATPDQVAAKWQGLQHETFMRRAIELSRKGGIEERTGGWFCLSFRTPASPDQPEGCLLSPKRAGCFGAVIVDIESQSIVGEGTSPTIYALSGFSCLQLLHGITALPRSPFKSTQHQPQLYRLQPRDCAQRSHVARRNARHPGSRQGPGPARLDRVCALHISRAVPHVLLSVHVGAARPHLLRICV